MTDQYGGGYGATPCPHCSDPAAGRTVYHAGRRLVNGALLGPLFPHCPRAPGAAPPEYTATGRAQNLLMEWIAKWPYIEVSDPAWEDLRARIAWALETRP